MFNSLTKLVHDYHFQQSTCSIFSAIYILRSKVECSLNFCGLNKSLNYLRLIVKVSRDSERKYLMVMKYFAFRMLDPGSCQDYFVTSSHSHLIRKLGRDTNIRIFLKIFRKFHDIYNCLGFCFLQFYDAAVLRAFQSLFRINFTVQRFPP